MAKGYWIVLFRSVSNPAALTEYSKLAGPAIETGGGRIVARGMPVKVFEEGVHQRTVIVEFDSAEKAIATYQGPAYQAALKLLKGAVERDVRIMEGV